MVPVIQMLNEVGLGAVYAATTRGGEYKSPCPNCKEKNADGGHDRLCVWPEEGWARCRQCKHIYDLVGLYAHQAKVGRTKACKVLGNAVQAPSHVMVAPKVLSQATWDARVEKVIYDRSRSMFQDEGEEQLAYLHSRGLKDLSIRTARLGACWEKRSYSRDKFGLAPAFHQDGVTPCKLFMHEGILIPCFDLDGKCISLQLRCMDNTYGRYRMIPGSRVASMVLFPEGEVEAAVVVESALDAILCHQEAPDRFAFVAIGSTDYSPDLVAETLFLNVPHVLVATDNDDAGKAACHLLCSRFENASHFVLPSESAKDVGEAFLEGLNIADWCDQGLDKAKNKGRSPKSKAGVKLKARTGDDTSTTLKNPSGILDVEYQLVRTPKKALAALEELLSADVIAIDLETTPLAEYAGVKKAALDPYLARPRLLQATTGGMVYIFDLNKIKLQDLAPLFQKKWVAHNGVFDFKFLLYAGLEPKPTAPHCTMLMDNALNNRLCKLDVLFVDRFRIPMDKTLQTSDWSADALSEEQLQYAARDVVAVMRLWEKLSTELAERQRERLYALMHNAQEAIAMMELAGIGFDVAAHKQLVKQWEKEYKRAQKNLAALAGDAINLDSPKQVAKFLEAHASEDELKAWPRTKTGQLRTAADKIGDFTDNKAVGLLMGYRLWSERLKMFGNELDTKVHPVTKRLHPHFRIAGALTGRMSASEPNVQGMPKLPEFRRLFIAPSGRAFVAADLNQCQLRVMAILSGDARLLGAYEQGLDVHRMTAAGILGKKPGEVTQDERSLAKAIGFGILFGIGAKSLRSYAMSNYGVSITVEEAEDISARFFETYPDVLRWQKQKVKEVRETGSSLTPMGRNRNFIREGKEYLYAAAMNTPIQGGEAEVMLAALGRLSPKALARLDACLVNCVHDEILLECPEENVEEVQAMLRECMEKGMREVFPSASLKGLVEIAHGSTWADAK